LRQAICALSWLAAVEGAFCAGPVGTTVQCVFADGRAYSFGPGRDRCWDPINARTLHPRTALACANPRDDGSVRVTFVYSEANHPDCDDGRPATETEVLPALPQLGSNERKFFLSGQTR